MFTVYLESCAIFVPFPFRLFDIHIPIKYVDKPLVTTLTLQANYSEPEPYKNVDDKNEIGWLVVKCSVQQRDLNTGVTESLCFTLIASIY